MHDVEEINEKEECRERVDAIFLDSWLHVEQPQW